MQDQVEAERGWLLKKHPTKIACILMIFLAIVFWHADCWTYSSTRGIHKFSKWNLKIPKMTFFTIIWKNHEITHWLIRPKLDLLNQRCLKKIASLKFVVSNHCELLWLHCEDYQDLLIKNGIISWFHTNDANIKSAVFSISESVKRMKVCFR